MTRSSSHEWIVRLIVSATPRPAEYRVIAETARGAIHKAMKHVRASDGFVTVSARVRERHVDASAYRRDCELVAIPDSPPQKELRI